MLLVVFCEEAMSGYFPSRFMPCPACGGSCERAAVDEHACDPERRLDFRLFQLRSEIAGLEDAVRAYLESARGRFELWYAARERRRWG